MIKTFYLLTSIFLVSCSNSSTQNEVDLIRKMDKKFAKNTSYISDGFDFPVGKPDAKGYYNAQRFRENNHLGDDWNGVGGGNTDLGDPIYAISNGYVSFAEDVGGGWGNIIRIIHKLPDGSTYDYIESLYAHCDEIVINTDAFIKKGTKIGSIGSNSGMYPAHLHFEIRSVIGMDIGGGYNEDTSGYLDPTVIIMRNRNLE